MSAADLEKKMGEISELIVRRAFREAKSKLIDFELLTAHISYSDQQLGLPYLYLLLSFLVTDDIISARFLWKRLPPGAKKFPPIARSWQVGKALWQKSYPDFFAACNVQWPAKAGVLVEALKDNVRKSNLDLISRTYSRVAIGDVLPLVGWAPEELLQVVRSKGWDYDPQAKLLKPVSAPPPPVSLENSVDLLANMTQYVIGLDA